MTQAYVCFRTTRSRPSRWGASTTRGSRSRAVFFASFRDLRHKSSTCFDTAAIFLCALCPSIQTQCANTAAFLRALALESQRARTTAHVVHSTEFEMTDPIYTAQQINIPPDLPEILKQFTKAAIKTQPSDLLLWSQQFVCFLWPRFTLADFWNLDLFNSMD